VCSSAPSSTLPSSDQEQLTIEAISTEAVTTSEIEGEILDRTSVQSSIRRQLGLATDNRRVPVAEQGISEMMVDLYRSFAEPLSDDMLFSWHRMLLKARGVSRTSAAIAPVTRRWR
jgi:Fic family protein